MNVKKSASHPTLGSKLDQLDRHVVKPAEYRELPELTEAMLAGARLRKGGRPRLAQAKQSISLRMPVAVIEQWRATGPGWQTRMVERLQNVQGAG